MTFEDPFKPDDHIRPVSTFLPTTSTPTPPPHGVPHAKFAPSLSDTLGLYAAILFVITALGAIALYVILAAWAYRKNKRLRTPPDLLTADAKRAAEVQAERAAESAQLPEKSTHHGCLLPTYGTQTAAARRALVVNSAAPGHYSNYNFALAQSPAPVPTALLIDDSTLTLAPDDAPAALAGRFDPAAPRFDDPRAPAPRKRNILFGFFHPYANAGGGGERVLWAAVKATLLASPQNVCVVYTGLDTRKEPLEKLVEQQHQQPAPSTPATANAPASILASAARRFGIEVDPKRVLFIYLPRRHLVDPRTYPRLTLVGQAIGSAMLAAEAVSRLVPDVFVDTMGYPFAYPYVSAVTGIPIAAYVHYPVISSDMIAAMVANIDNLDTSTPPAAHAPKSPSHKSTSLLLTALGSALRAAKYLYWQAFALAYTYAGSYVSVVMVNSSWTLAHMRRQWALGHTSSTGSPVPGSRIQTLYPPCATQDLDSASISDPRGNTIVYVAQFRAEKRHELVLREFARFRDAFVEAQAKAQTNTTTLPSSPLDSRITALRPPKLVLVGSIRNDLDRRTVYHLRLLARELQLTDSRDVEFVLDAPWPAVTELLKSASIGVNAMWNEHFGMVVVEYMAAGLIPVVHNSGGPKLDIVVPFAGTQDPAHQQALPTGFLFRAPQDPCPNYSHEPGSKEKYPESVATIDNTDPINAQTLDPALLNNPGIQDLADCLFVAYTLPQDIQQGFRSRARQAANRFSDAAFAAHWSSRVELLLKLEKRRRHERLSQSIVY